MTSLRYARGPLSSGRRFVRWMNHVRQVDSVLPADGGRPVRPTQTYGRASLHAISLTGTRKAPSGTNEDRASTLRLVSALEAGSAANVTCVSWEPDQGTPHER
jgi:hypothetical protein